VARVREHLELTTVLAPAAVVQDIYIPKRQALLEDTPETTVHFVHEIDGNGVNIEFDWEMDEYDVCAAPAEPLFLSE